MPASVTNVSLAVSMSMSVYKSVCVFVCVCVCVCILVSSVRHTCLRAANLFRS